MPPPFPPTDNTNTNHTAFKRGDWEGALAQSFLTLDRQLAAEAGQRELGELARVERERSREQVRASDERESQRERGRGRRAWG